MNKKLIISDFSKTLTSSSNPTTWSVFAKSGLLGKGYIQERDNFFQKYYPFEQQKNIEKTKEWWKHHLSLFVKYGLTLELIQKIVRDSKYFEPRQGLKEFFEKVFDYDIEFIIITSSGVSNFVYEFLKSQSIDTSKIQIIGNSLEINTNGNVIGYKDDIITSLNKGEYAKDYSGYEQVFLIGDDESDVDMYTGKNVTKLGFCSEDIIGYDVYLGKQGSLLTILEYL